MNGQLKPAIMSLVLLTLITGVAYPLVVTAIAQLVFPGQANGSLILKDGKPIGSMLIGQPFDDPKYFWSRPSATSPFADNAGNSAGSNLGPTNSLSLQRRRFERIQPGAHPSGPQGGGGRPGAGSAESRPG